jgi:hypothetical protein
MPTSSEIPKRGGTGPGERRRSGRRVGLTFVGLLLLSPPVSGCAQQPGSDAGVRPVDPAVVQGLVERLDRLRTDSGLPALERRADLDALALSRALQVAALPPTHRLSSRPGPLSALLTRSGHRGYRRVAEHLDVRLGNRPPAELYRETWRFSPEVLALALDPDLQAVGVALLRLDEGGYVLSALFQEDVPARVGLEAMERRAVEAVNRVREEHGLHPLRIDDRLTAVARAFSERMAAEGFFDHTTPDGQTTVDRVRAAGIAYLRLSENLQYNNDRDPVPNAVRSWLESPGHRANLLDDGVTRTGIGIAFDDQGGVYFTQLFLRPR